MSRAKQRGDDRTNDGERDLVVVDGSNIATEGRSVPSLSQLNEAVLSFRQEFPDVNVTVVVDATFGHRIDKREVATFDEAVAHNELVAPPAGAVGRGDAFVLGIADKSKARVLSNDSFQEFHGTHPWLFDEGRLIGGKPVPHVGWVFVNRVPVKGAVSRKARADAADKAPSRRSASKRASEPMPVPSAPPPGTAKPSRRQRQKQAAEEPTAATPAAAAVPRGGPVNDLLPFLDFVEHHPIGTSVTGVVESYSSHGAYVTVGDVRGYVPLRLMSNPPPRSAREAMKVGEPVTLVVDNFAPARRSIDMAVPGVGEAAAEPAAKPDRAGGPRKAKAAAKAAAKATAAGGTKRVPAKKAPAKATADQAAAKKPAAKKATAKPAASKKAAARKEPAKKAEAKKAEAKKVATPKQAAESRKAAAKSAATPKRAAEPKKAAGKQEATPKRAAAKKSPVGRSPSKQSEPQRSGSTRRRAATPTANKAASSRPKKSSTRTS